MKNYLDWLLRQGQEDFWLEQDNSGGLTAAGITEETALSPLPDGSEMELGAEVSSPSETSPWEDDAAGNGLPSLWEQSGAQERRLSHTMELDGETLPLTRGNGTAAFVSGGAALTAAALDKLVQRDARRYDQGFSLL